MAIILGLGTNLGDRKANFKKAIYHIANWQGTPLVRGIDLSSIYFSQAMLSPGSPPEWDKPYFNMAIKGETDRSPLDILKNIKDIERKMGRVAHGPKWGPRIIDIDILAWDDLVIHDEAMEIPQHDLPMRPFSLLPLAELIPQWRYPLPGPYHGQTADGICCRWRKQSKFFAGLPPFQTRQVDAFLPAMVGIVNLAPDSFSDGGCHASPEQAASHAVKLFEEGAKIIDIGAEATNPKVSRQVSREEEWERLGPGLTAIKAGFSEYFSPPLLSVDTRHAETARKAIAFGIDWVNDVTGLQSEEMKRVIAESDVDVVVMHSMGVPPGRDRKLPQDRDPVDYLLGWGEERLRLLEKSGISRERVIVDPGIGFGTGTPQAFYILEHCRRLHELGARILVGHSRKSFLDLCSNRIARDRDVETRIVSAALSRQNVHYLRVHDPAGNARACKVAFFLELYGSLGESFCHKGTNYEPEG